MLVLGEKIRQTGETPPAARRSPGRVATDAHRPRGPGRGRAALLLAGVLHDGVIGTYGWPQVVSVACLALIWRNAPEGEQAAMQRLVEPLGGLGTGGGRMRRGTAIRLIAAVALLLGGLGW